MYFHSNDPVADAEGYAAYCEKQDAQYEHCYECEATLYNGAFEIDGLYYCSNCAMKIFNEYGDDFECDSWEEFKHNYWEKFYYEG